MIRPESDHDLTHDWHLDGERCAGPSLAWWCPDCLIGSRVKLDAPCPDRVKRALDRRFLAGARAGLEAAARECSPYCVDSCAHAIRAIDPTKLEKSHEP